MELSVLLISGYSSSIFLTPELPTQQNTTALFFLGTVALSVVPRNRDCYWYQKWRPETWNESQTSISTCCKTLLVPGKGSSTLHRCCRKRDLQIATRSPGESAAEPGKKAMLRHPRPSAHPKTTPPPFLHDTLGWKAAMPVLHILCWWPSWANNIFLLKIRGLGTSLKVKASVFATHYCNIIFPSLPTTSFMPGKDLCTWQPFCWRRH